LEKSLAVIKSDFQFLFVVFPGIDEFSHLSQCRHPEALKAYRNMDRSVGEVARELRRQGKYEETALFIVSDHGLSETNSHFGVASFLEKRGIKTFYYPKIFKRGFQAASMVSGNGMLHLYFKNHAGWSGRISREEVEETFPGLVQDLLENPAVDLIISQDHDGWVRVLSREGEAKVKEEGAQLHFVSIKGNPLGLNGVTSPLDSLSALKITENTPYPDSLLQLVQLFRSSRTGDLVLSAAKGFDLRKRFEHPEHKSSHGALHEDHMLIPLFSNVKINRSLVRSADLFPSILKLHGDPIPTGIDGVSFV
jgi:hypothetical protein